ncbi:MAG: 6,7-dimethyl-8-ribityllumazine synthase [Legionella sp.]|nr:6,7-dimethyl-8-ribityllumazine synthase [Legionella sp.]
MQNTALTTKNTSLAYSFPVAIIIGVFNREITQNLQEGTMAQLVKRGISKQDIQVYEVPGAIEIPFIAQRLAMQKK